VARQLAHEFQHVLEIASSELTGADSLKHLYERIGFQSCAPECYETWRALRVESLVSREVSAGAPSTNPAYFGAWLLDIGKSSFTACPPSAGRRFDRDQRHGLASAVVEYVDCVGIEHRDAFVYKADGREYPMPNHGRRPASISVSIIDRLTSTFTVKVDHVIVACGRRTLNANGTVLTIETWQVGNGEAQRTFEWWEKAD